MTQKQDTCHRHWETRQRLECWTFLLNCRHQWGKHSCSSLFRGHAGEVVCQFCYTSDAFISNSSVPLWVIIIGNQTWEWTDLNSIYFQCSTVETYKCFTELLIMSSLQPSYSAGGLYELKNMGKHHFRSVLPSSGLQEKLQHQEVYWLKF